MPPAVVGGVSLAPVAPEQIILLQSATTLATATTLHKRVFLPVEHDHVERREDDEYTDDRRAFTCARAHAHVGAPDRGRHIHILDSDRDEVPDHDKSKHRVLRVHHRNDRKRDHDAQVHDVGLDREVATVRVLQRDRQVVECDRRHPRNVDRDRQLTADILSPVHRHPRIPVVHGVNVEHEQRKPEDEDHQGRGVYVMRRVENQPCRVGNAGDRETRAQLGRLGRVRVERGLRVEDVREHEQRFECVDEDPDGERERRRRDQRLVLTRERDKAPGVRDVDAGLHDKERGVEQCEPAGFHG